MLTAHARLCATPSSGLSLGTPTAGPAEPPRRPTGSWPQAALPSRHGGVSGRRITLLRGPPAAGPHTVEACVEKHFRDASRSAGFVTATRRYALLVQDDELENRPCGFVGLPHRAPPAQPSTCCPTTARERPRRAVSMDETRSLAHIGTSTSFPALAGPDPQHHGRVDVAARLDRVGRRPLRVSLSNAPDKPTPRRVRHAAPCSRGTPASWHVPQSVHDEACLSPGRPCRAWIVAALHGHTKTALSP